MDAERLLELFQTKPTVTDAPDAKPLKFQEGSIRFEKVTFAYDQRSSTLKNVSFTVPGGKTVALCGETGGGKSTILKLIDRFYDCASGSITIDGQDLRDVQLSRYTWRKFHSLDELTLTVYARRSELSHKTQACFMIQS